MRGENSLKVKIANLDFYLDKNDYIYVARLGDWRFRLSPFVVDREDEKFLETYIKRMIDSNLKPKQKVDDCEPGDYIRLPNEARYIGDIRTYIAHDPNQTAIDFYKPVVVNCVDFMYLGGGIWQRLPIPEQKPQHTEQPLFSGDKVEYHIYLEEVKDKVGEFDIELED